MTVGEVAISVGLLLNAAALLLGTRKLTHKVDIIHGLVNSNMTAALESERDAVMRELATMREIVAMRSAAGTEPSVDTLSTIRVTELRILELKSALADRGVEIDD